MEFEYKAKTVEEAIEIGLKDLKAKQEDVDIVILDEGGFFGIKKAKIKIITEDIKPKAKKESAVAPVKELKVAEEKPAVKEEKKGEKPVQQIKEQPKQKVEEKKVEPKKEEKVEKIEQPKEEKIEVEEKEQKEKDVVEEEVEEQKEKGYKVNPAELDGFIRKFLVEFAKEQNVEVEVEGIIRDGMKIYVLKGDNAHKLIGYHGENINAMQIITAAVISEKYNISSRVLIDIENYREKREESLRILARRNARKVIQTGKSVRLEPMTPNERRIIHTELQNNKKVTTESFGVEPNRYLTIKLR